MSELAEATAAGDSAALPGYILSKPRLKEIGEAEQEFENEYLELNRRASAHLAPDNAEHIMSAAIATIARGEYALGGYHFDVSCQRGAKLPYLTWLSLRVKHPQLTREQVNDLITPENEGAVASAVLRLWGYPGTKKAIAPSGSRDESLGAASSNISEPVAA